MTPSSYLKSYVNPFDVGSLVTGKDETFNFTNIKTGITVKDQTCSVAGDVNQNVPLGSYTTNPTSGLGAGIGQTSAATAFNIQFNCEALLSGTFGGGVKRHHTHIGEPAGRVSIELHHHVKCA